MAKETVSSLVDMVKEAISVEKYGNKLYLDTAKKTSNLLVKKTFLALADDEKKHIKALCAFYRTLSAGTACPVLDALYAKSHKKAWGRVFKKPVKQINCLRGRDKNKVLKVYDIAMGLEEEGYRFYAKALGKSKSKEEKALFAFLIKEENAHYELLRKSKQYLETPEEFYLKEEKPIVEG